MKNKYDAGFYFIAFLIIAALGFGYAIGDFTSSMKVAQSYKEGAYDGYEQASMDAMNIFRKESDLPEFESLKDFREFEKDINNPKYYHKNKHKLNERSM